MINKNVFDGFNKTIAIRTISFVLFTLFSSIAVKIIRLFIVFDCPKYWPVSVFRFRIPNWGQLRLFLQEN